jgi:hypothetical protein
VRAHRVLAVLAVSVVWGCPSPYLSADMAQPIQAFGCVDVHADCSWPAESTGPVATIDLGNRCDHGVVVDLGAIHATAVHREYEADHATACQPYDPDQEIRPRALSPGAHGAEWIEYHPIEAMDRIDMLVLDLGHIVPGEPSGVRLELAVPARPSPGDGSY